MAKFEDRRSTSSAAENMNPRQDLLEEIVKMLKKGKLSYEIRSYLQGKVQNETELEQLIDEARLLMFQKDSKSKPKIHLAAFVLFCLLSIFTIVYLFAFLPSSNFMIGGTVLAILGTALFFVFVTLSLAFYKSWKPEKEYLDKPKSFAYGLVFVIFIIPATIVAFAVDMRYHNAQSELLAENFDYSIGRVISGQAYKMKIRRSRMNVSNVTISFATRKGEKVSGKYDVPESWHYYLPHNQKVLVKYNPDRPKNFKITFDANEIERYTTSDERIWQLEDLVKMYPLKTREYTRSLEKITFGWMYIDDRKGWINLRQRMMAVRKRSSMDIRMTRQYAGLMLEYLQSEGFVQDTLSRSRNTFIKEDMTVRIERARMLGMDEDFNNIDMDHVLKFSIKKKERKKRKK